MQAEWRIESLQIAKIVMRHTEERSITTGQFALAWVLNNHVVYGAVVWPREHGAADGKLGCPRI